MLADQLTTSGATFSTDPEWEQVNVEFTDATSAATVAAQELRPLLNQIPGGWWYIRKPPHWRFRHYAASAIHHLTGDVTTDVSNPRPRSQLRAALDELTRDGALRAWHSAIYEPETLAFGGSSGMKVAHDLFRRDSPVTLDLVASPLGSPTVAGRAELSLLAISRMLRAAGLDWYEQGDVWARVADSRRGPDVAIRSIGADAPAAVRRLLTLDTRPDTALVTNGPLSGHRVWLGDFDAAGTELRALARIGNLSRGLRAVLAHHIIFHWNRLALPGSDQHTLAALARDALLPADLPEKDTR